MIEAVMLWPGGRPAAATSSWDDGTVHDRQLIKILNRHGVPATFFLNSGKLGLTAQQSGFWDYVSPAEVGSLYADHEVGVHTVTHPSLPALPDHEVREEIQRDRTVLESLTGRPVTGFAPPFGDVDDRVRRLAAAAGMGYCRGIAATGGFAVPADPMAWEPTLHMGDSPEATWRRFCDDPAAGRLLAVWGHSYELADADSWDAVDSFLAEAAPHPQIWWATHAGIADYLAAWRGLREEDGAIVNPSDHDVVLGRDGGVCVVPARGSIRFPCP